MRRAITFAIRATAVVGLAAAVIGSFRAIARPGESASTEGDYGGTVDVAAADPTPPTCNGFLYTILDEPFDSVTPPLLPDGWTAINGIDPDGILWQTSNSGLPSPPYDTAPNAAWVNDPPVISDKYLDAPAVYATESYYVWMTFRHNFNLEASDVDPNVGFDGGVLEISMDGGQTFQDITNWGSFVTGGYNRTIAPDRGSPIAGRRAWSGNSGGFITTVVYLPNELPGTILRWRMASDNTGSSEGWRVDTTEILWCHFKGTPTPPPPTPTITPTPTPTPPRATCPQYIITEGTGTIVPGSTDTGNHCDWCDTLIPLPFPFVLYGQTFTAVNVTSSGRLDFVCDNEPAAYEETCPPAPPNNCPYDFTIFALWHEWYTGIGATGCSTWANGCGIFTSISGSAPNRIFNIEWHVVDRDNDSQAANFEVRLYENDHNKRFDVIYGTISEVWYLNAAGVQGPTEFFTDDFCNVPAPQNTSHTYELEPCATPIPTPTPTATATPRVTPRPRPTPMPRPTPP